MAMVNDPLRGDGWWPWFSGSPNDIVHYEMLVKTSDDVQHLVNILATIEGSSVQIFLSPQAEPRGVGAGMEYPEGNGIGVMFSIGSQKNMDQWYEHLPEIEPGVREFGVHRYEKPPVARPPTFELYVGNSAVDLKKLIIPGKIEVQAGYSDRYREQHKDDKVVQEIEKVVKEHRAKAAAEDLKAAATVTGATKE